MDPMEEIKQTFFIECGELLEVLEDGLLQMEGGDQDEETVNAVFRAVHSIKGGAGAFGLDHLVRFAHKFENTLDLVRSDKLDTTPKVMAILLKAGDALSDLVALARDDEDQETPAARELIVELVALSEADGKDEEAAAASGAFDTSPSGEDKDGDPSFAPMPLSLDALDDERDGDAPFEATPAVAMSPRYVVKFRPHAKLFELGSEPVLLFRALAELGSIRVFAEADALPTLDALDLSADTMAFLCEVETDAGIAAVEEVFEFVQGECDLEISSEESGQLGGDVPADGPDEDRTAELEGHGAPAEEAAPEIPAERVPPANEERPTPSASDNKNTPEKAPVSQAKTPKATVRVDIERVDRLINLVGELVINQAGIVRFVDDKSGPDDAAATNTIEEFKQLTRELQDSVMALRTQPVKPLFQRMQRICREAAAASDKTVRLKVSGEATEVDKTVIERLADPLTHMIRNAIDHGLESSEERLAKGKPEEGSVTLTAAHRSGRVVIEIADDGAGINRARVKAKAIEKGLVHPDANLSNSEIDNLLFAPGFSTAAKVTNLSGRGVGMDVVKRSIQALGGKINIQSQPGHGTTFTISLPLTLAVMDGMVVEVGEHTVIVPLTAILETHKPSRSQLFRVAGEDRVLSVRGQYVPVVDVGEIFAYRGPVGDLTEHVVLLAETEDGQRAALVVDTIVDQRQVVIKGLEKNYGQVSGVSAATILGDGSIALILDTDDLISRTKATDEGLMEAVA